MFVLFVQGAFLSEWDGLSSQATAAPVVVVGATNRPMDLDKAFLRRMPVSIKMVHYNCEDHLRNALIVHNKFIEFVVY